MAGKGKKAAGGFHHGNQAKKTSALSKGSARGGGKLVVTPNNVAQLGHKAG